MMGRRMRPTYPRRRGWTYSCGACIGEGALSGVVRSVMQALPPERADRIGQEPPACRWPSTTVDAPPPPTRRQRVEKAGSRGAVRLPRRYPSAGAGRAPPFVSPGVLARPGQIVVAPRPQLNGVAVLDDDCDPALGLGALSAAGEITMTQVFPIETKIEPYSQADAEKLNPILLRLAAQDPNFRFHVDPESGELIFAG